MGARTKQMRKALSAAAKERKTIDLKIDVEREGSLTEKRL
jgi:hypothetical protein